MSWGQGCSPFLLSISPIPEQFHTTLAHSVPLRSVLDKGSIATWHTTVQTTSERREQNDLTYNLQTDYGLTVVEREHSDLTHNSANYQWRKGAQRPDIQYFSLCHRPLLEGSKATWWTTLSAAAWTIVGREQSNLMDNTICVRGHLHFHP